MITIDTSVLLSFYQAKAGIGAAAGSGASGTGGTTGKNPTPPWSPTSTAPKMSDLVKKVMGGADFVDVDAAKLDASVNTPDGAKDYKNLFGLYQALNALEGLAEQASAKGVGDLQRRSLNRRFEAGMKEVQDFIATSPFKSFDVVQGTATDKAQTTVGAKAQADTYTTKTLYTGPMNGEVPDFQGPVAFSMTAKGLAGTETTVDFDLSEMGSTPRSMGNVVMYMNDKLQQAGLVTRFANQRTPGQPLTVTSNGKTTDLGTVGPDQFALTVKGTSTEVLTFSAPTQQPAVYISQMSGKTTGEGADPQAQFFKLNGDDPDAPKITSSTLGHEVAGVRASATGVDGSVYLLADVTSKTADGQPIKGEGDVALMKYDSAGTLLYTRTLGALDLANGYGLAVSADGKQVAIAGSVTGGLDINDPVTKDLSGADSFVSVFNAGGEELWTQRRGAVNGDDHINSVNFGDDGKVYVAGTTSSAMPGNGSLGSTDGFISSFSARAFTPPGETTIWTPSAAYTTQFGTAGTDRSTGIAVQGTTAYVSSIEDGHGVIRSYQLQPTGAPVLQATRDLGDLMGGSLAGIGIGPSGEILVAGSTHNGALNAGSVTNPYGGDGEVFVAKLSADLQPAGSDRLTYYSGEGDTNVGGMTVADGQVYVTGRVAGPPTAASGTEPSQQGYAVQIDPTTGAVGWSKRFDGAEGVAVPNSIAVDTTGTSILDKLGLPRGTIDYGAQPSVVSATSLRPGDQFKVRSGTGSPVNITIDVNDTYQTLAQKIGRATNFGASATTITVDGRTQLRIAPATARNQIEIIAGPEGRDALASLGLSEGLLDKDVLNPPKPKVGDVKSTGKIYGLKLPTTLTLDGDADNAKRVQGALMAAITGVQDIYRDMTGKVTAPGSGSGTVSSYVTDRIANYQEALNRLTGG